MTQTITHPRDVPTRLDELRGLEDGWYWGDGFALTDSGLDWLSDTFVRLYSADLPLPYTYPHFEGGILMEWFEDDKIALDLHIDIDTHSARLFWFYLDEDGGNELQLNLDDVKDWQTMNSEIHKILNPTQKEER